MSTQPIPIRRPLGEMLGELRDALADEGRLAEASVLDVFADIASHVGWGRSNVTTETLFADAWRATATCGCDPCEDCDKPVAGPRCDCEKCPHCGGRLD